MSYLRVLRFSAIGLVAVLGLSACHPTYVHESYQESYLYRPMPAYSPSYSVQYYSTAPTYVERRTIVVPQVVMAPRRAGHVDDRRPTPGSNRHDPNHRVEDRGGDFRNRVTAQPNHASNHNSVQVMQQNRGDSGQPTVSRPNNRESKRDRPDRKGPHGRDN